MAQLVEHVIGNDEVISSTLITSSKKLLDFLVRELFLFFFCSSNKRRNTALLLTYSLAVGNYAFGRAAPVRLVLLAS